MSLRIESLVKRFGGVEVLHDVSLHVRDGDCYGFLGHNGAGKTTTMRIVLGLMAADSGRVVVDGYDTQTHRTEAQTRLSGLIERPGFHGALGGRANLVLLARLQGLGRKAAAADADRVLAAVGLTHAAAKPVRAYSQGMRQRLGIAQALLGEPRYVLLDEPTNGLDPEGIEEMRALLRRLTREEGVTVLLSSHQLHELAGLCTRVGILRQGELLVEEDVSSLLGGTQNRYTLRSPDGKATQEALDALKITSSRLEGGAWSLHLGDGTPSNVARDLVERGVGLTEFALRPPTLEEVYLHYTRDVKAPVQGVPESPEPDEPRGKRCAPALPTYRVLRYELSRWTSGPWVPVLLLTPAALGLGGILLRWQEARAAAERAASGDVFSVTSVTAFESVGSGLRAGLLPCALVVAGLASQSLAGELSRGTLRNVLLRPARRLHVAAGKVLALLAAGAVAYLLLVLTILVCSAGFFDFSDVAELLPNGEPYVLRSADELWPALQGVLVAPLLPLACYTLLGFLAGAVTRGGVGGLGLASGLVVLLEMLRAVFRSLDVENLLPSAYLPSPLGDTSAVARFLDLAQGVSNPVETVGVGGHSVLLLWTITAFVLGYLALRRKAVP